MVKETSNQKKAILPLAPASFFAMTLGLAETGNAWRNATYLWRVNGIVGEIFQVFSVLSFFWWLAVYINKWVNYQNSAKSELNDPIQVSFVALIPESIILMALAILPYFHTLAQVLFWLGSILNLLYGTYCLSLLWMRNREPNQITPSLFLTYTASILVNSLVAGIFGFNNYGFALLGIGGISWLIMDSVITQHLIVGSLAVKTRNFMGIYMAPSAIILVAYQVLSGESSNLKIIYALMGYALFILLGLGFSFKWLREQEFAPGYWAYTFGLATLTQGLILATIRSQNSFIEVFAFSMMFLTNLAVFFIAIGSIRLIMSKRYFPK